MAGLAGRLGPFIVFLARVAIGVVVLMHGLQKFFFNGLDATSSFFQSLDVPAPDVLAPLAGAVEVVGGVAFIVGAFMPLFSLLFAVDLLGAFWYLHRHNGFWASDVGYEWVIALGAAALLIGFGGGGAFSLGRSGSRAGGQDRAASREGASTA